MQSIICICLRGEENETSTIPSGNCGCLAPPARLVFIPALRESMFGAVQPSPATLIRVALNCSSLLKVKHPQSLVGLWMFGTPGETRTHYLTLRRRTLYPGELRGRMLCKVLYPKKSLLSIKCSIFFAHRRISFVQFSPLQLPGFPL